MADPETIGNARRSRFQPDLLTADFIVILVKLGNWKLEPGGPEGVPRDWGMAPDFRAAAQKDL